MVRTISNEKRQMMAAFKHVTLFTTGDYIVARCRCDRFSIAVAADGESVVGLDEIARESYAHILNVHWWEEDEGNGG